MADDRYVAVYQADTRAYIIDINKGTAATERFAAASARSAGALGNLTGATSKTRTGLTGLTSATSRSTAQTTAASQAASQAAAQQARLYSGLANTRYALVSTALTWGAVSAATLGAVGAIEKLGIAYESQFAQVARTTGGTSKELGQLHDQLVDLTTAIPESFQNVTAISALGGQLGIATEDVNKFTDVTAKLAATTDLSSEAAGTAIGRFQALGLVSQDTYGNLASSILKVGVNSVATESQITTIATQISSMGKLAGLSADQIVGLSGALASVGAQPELARGTVTRFFTQITKALDEGGTKLETFARLAGVSADQFRAAWGTSQFATLLPTMFKSISDQGDQALATLKSIGITSVRDVPLLTRLGQANDTVTDSFENAASGFSQNTELNKQYGIIAATTAAKLTELANSLKALLAGMADSPIVGAAAEALLKFSNALRWLLNNPAGHAFTSIVLGATLVLGVFAAVRTATALLQAALLGLIQVQNSLSASSLEVGKGLTGSVVALGRYIVTGQVAIKTNQKLGASFTGVGTAAEWAAARERTAAVGAQSMGAAFAAMSKSTIVLAAISAAIYGVSKGFSAISGALESNTKKTGEFLGGWDGLTDALKQDTSAGADAAGVIRTVDGAITTSTEHLPEWGKSLEAGTHAQSDLAQASATNTNEIDHQSLVIAGNTRAWLANALANGEFAKIWRDNSTALKGLGFSIKDYTDAVLGGNGEQYIQGLSDKLKASLDALSKSGISDVQFQDAAIQASETDSALDRLRHTAQGFESEITTVANKQALVNEAMGVTGAAASDASDGFDDLGDSAQSTVDALSDLVDLSLGAANSNYALMNSIGDLGKSLAENGNDFSQYTAAGQANWQALQQVIQAAITASNGDAAALATNVQAVLNTLSNYGVNVAAQLSNVQGLIASLTGGKGVAGLFMGTENLATATTQASAAFSNGYVPAVKKATTSTASAAKQVYTLTDYVNDLAGVLKSAADIRFGLSESVDASADAFDKLRQNSLDAKQAVTDAAGKLEDDRRSIRGLKNDIGDLSATIKGLKADRTILLYQLKVAQDYGDTLRATEIQADLTKNSQDTKDAQTEQADKQKDLSQAVKDYNADLKILAAAQRDVKRDLSGSTQSARDQRAAVRELAQSYADQIVAYANTGASSDAVKTKTDQLKQKFIDQVTQLGYNRTEVGKYADSFDDVKYAIDHLPKNITINGSANMSPAQRAISDFLAKNSKGRGYSGGSGITIPVKTNIVPLTAAQKSAAALGLQKIFNSVTGKMVLVAPDGKTATAAAWKLQSNVATYAAGGYTGSGGKYEPAGVVHKGEYVVPKQYVNQSTGLPYADAYGAISRGYASGGFVSAPSPQKNTIQLVELLPNQIQQIVSALSVVVAVDGRTITNTVNSQNNRSSNNGSY